MIVGIYKSKYVRKYVIISKWVLKLIKNNVKQMWINCLKWCINFHNENMYI